MFRYDQLQVCLRKHCPSRKKIDLQTIRVAEDVDPYKFQKKARTPFF